MTLSRLLLPLVVFFDGGDSATKRDSRAISTFDPRQKRRQCELCHTLPALTIALLGGCGGGGGDAPSEPVAAAPQAGAVTPAPLVVRPKFVDVTGSSGIDHRIEFLGRDFSVPDTGGAMAANLVWITLGGAAAGDCDRDGDIDVFIVRGDARSNLLYRNLGALTFTDVAASAGVAYTKSAAENYAHSGPTFADMDGDGDLDLFLGGLFGDPSKVFQNNGDCTFEDVTDGSGIDTLDSPHNVSAAFGDYDLDGYLDLFVSHWGTPRDLENPGDTENLWRNISSGGKIAFESVSEAALVSPSIITLDDPRDFEDPFEFTFTPTFARINDDLHPDVLSVAVFNQTMLFINNRDGTFSNATDVDVLIDDNGMGSALGDFDGDGDLDWFVSSIHAPNLVLTSRVPYPRGNRLYRNDGGVFTDVSASAGIADGGWGWAACFLDLENDGDLDIYHTNGWPLRFLDITFERDISRVFVSDGNGRFTERASRVGLADADDARGVVCADFDNDGDVDILQLHRRRGISVTLWKNDTAGNNYLRVRLRGKAPNTEAAGARIWARIGEREQMREVRIGSNYLTQNPTVQIFGLKSASNVDELRIEWPDGCVTRKPAVVANQTFVADQSDCTP